jgi:ATP-dependent protease ClpP protease subunit
MATGVDKGFEQKFTVQGKGGGFPARDYNPEAPLQFFHGGTQWPWKRQKTTYIHFAADINATTVEQLLGVIFQQIGAGAAEIVLLFSTPGGHIDAGITLYNTLNGLPVPLTMHNVGNVDSIGNAIFMAGKRRLTTPHSSFLFHGVKWGFGQNQQLSRTELHEITENLAASERKIAGIISEKSSLKLEEINGFFAKAKSIDPQEALDRGIVHSVEDVRIPAGVNPIQLVFRR